MRKRWLTSLALSLGILTAGARAGEDSWSGPPRSSTPPRSRPDEGWGRPAPRGSASAPASPTGPSVQLGRPVAVLARPVPRTGNWTDSYLKQAAYSDSWSTDGGAVVRGQMTDNGIPRPMPVGPVTADAPTRPFVWQAAKTQITVPPGPTIEEIPAPREASPTPPMFPVPGPFSGPNPIPVPGSIVGPRPVPGPVLDTPPGVIGAEPHPGVPGFPTTEDCCEDAQEGCCTDGVCCNTDACCTDGACCTNCCCADCCCGCYPGNRFYVSGEYLLWWTKGSQLPPLLTTATGPFSATNNGTLGQPGTQVLVGDQSVATSARSGRVSWPVAGLTTAGCSALKWVASSSSR